MADNTDEEHLDNPSTTQSENPSDEIIPTTDLETNKPNQDTENMEVHHHPDLHHKRKDFKEYFLEFLMIFLAVTMGFFAESYREHLKDQRQEKEFIVSLKEDIISDTIQLNVALSLGKLQYEKLDSLYTLL